MQLKNSKATDIEAWKKNITELWVKKMADNDCLKKLVEGLLSRLLQLIERCGAYSNLNVFRTFYFICTLVCV
jgi:hypothetical protein